MDVGIGILALKQFYVGLWKIFYIIILVEELFYR